MVDNKITEKVNPSNYLRNLIYCEKEVDTDSKLNKYLKITGNINNVWRPQEPLKKRIMQLCNTLAFQLFHVVVKICPLKQEMQEE